MRPVPGCRVLLSSHALYAISIVSIFDGNSVSTRRRLAAPHFTIRTQKFHAFTMKI
jgi:hypothetical protein